MFDSFVTLTLLPQLPRFHYLPVLFFPGIKDVAGVSDAVKEDLCKLCKGDCKNNSATEPYYSYEGAFKCMAAGNDDRVGFVKQDTADKVIKADALLGPATKYKLLCSDGNTKGKLFIKESSETEV